MKGNAYMEETATNTNTEIEILAEEFLSHLATHNHSARSVGGYRYIMQYFSDFMKARGISSPLDVTPQDIDDYRLNLVERKFKQNSLYTYLRVIKLFFKFLHDHDHVFVNAAQDMKMLGPDKRLQPVPTEDEVTQLLTAPDTTTPAGIRDRAILETIYSAALRREEAAAVDQKDVDMVHCTIRILGKGERERIVPLGKEAMNWMKRYIEESRNMFMAINGKSDEPALWLNHHGKRLSGQHVNLLIKRYARSCEGIKTHITSHSLRRACATHMLQRGANPMEIQLLLGHADLSHLRNYLRLSIHDLKAAHEKTRLGQ
jgi:integrase/recombinase XerD